MYSPEPINNSPEPINKSPKPTSQDALVNKKKPHQFLKKIFSLCSTFSCGVILANNAMASPVYINEFHYDNAGSDKNEFVEVAGISGTNLDGWTLEFYNGGNGKRYMTWNLSGTLANTQQNMGIASFTGKGGIQNGNNDGIALVDDLGVVQQFLSYEGTLTATNASAQGLTSTDIGISESPQTSIGHSIYLSGAGTHYEDFVWTSGFASIGDINVQQSFVTTASHGVQPFLDTSPTIPTLPISLPDRTEPHAVNEPESLALLSMGIALLMLQRRLQSAA